MSTATSTTHYRPGYARVSTLQQDEALQHDALQASGCARIFTDEASGKLESRPALDALLDQARPGDTVVVWRLDRLGRSLRHLIETVALLEHRGVAFVSLTENIDTSTPGGRWFSTSSARWPSTSGTSSGRGPRPVWRQRVPGVGPAADQLCGPRRSAGPRTRCMSLASMTLPASPACWASAARLCTAPDRAVGRHDSPTPPSSAHWPEEGA